MGAELAREDHGALAARALAHQVDRAAGAARTLQQAGRAAQDLHAVIEHQRLLLPVAQAVGIARERQAVVLQRVHRKAARIDGQARAHALHGHHAGGVVDGVGQVGHALVVHALAREHADRLRNVLERLRGLAQRDRAAGVGVRAFGDAVTDARVGHHDGRQARLCPGGGLAARCAHLGQGAQRIAAIGLHMGGQPRAGQQRIQGRRRCMVSTQPRAAPARDVGRRVRQHDAAFLGEARQRALQRACRYGVAAHFGG